MSVYVGMSKAVVAPNSHAALKTPLPKATAGAAVHALVANAGALCREGDAEDVPAALREDLCCVVGCPRPVMWMEQSVVDSDSIQSSTQWLFFRYVGPSCVCPPPNDDDHFLFRAPSFNKHVSS